MKCKLILILFIKQNVETEFTLDQLDDEFDNNNGKDVGINGVIEMTILLKSHKFKSIFVGIKLGSQ